VAVSLRRAAPWIGIAGLVVVLWFYGFISLVAPWWMVPVMLVVWVGLLVLSLGWFRRHPYIVLTMPVVAVAIWVAVVSAGAHWLGWTA
jgi:hypothetical protein